MATIRYSVGRNGANHSDDVKIIQQLLQKNGASSLKVDGIYGVSTYKAIIQFQKQFYKRPDGLVIPGQKTFEKLNAIEHSPTPSKPQNSKNYDTSDLFEKAAGIVAPVTILPWQIAKNRGSIMEQFQQLLYPAVITIEMLDVVNPRGKGKIGANTKALPYLNKYANHFKMTNKRDIAHFLSQISAESFLIPQAEADGVKKWSILAIKRGFSASRLKGINLEDYRETRKLLNHVYANRMHNGNEASGDGYKYRGRGFIQLTGKDKYEKMQKFHHIEFPNDPQNFLDNPDLIADKSHYQYAVESAFIFWYKVPYRTIKGKGKNKGKVITVSEIASAEGSTVGDVTYAVNGGCNGYDKRLAAFNRIAKYLGVTQADEANSRHCGNK